MANATLYRDHEYGALGVIPTAEGILTVDHGFAPRDFEVVLDVLERNAREDVQGDGASLWRVVGHPLAVLGSIESALRARGYAEDALAERAIIAVSVETAQTPDLPVEARAAGYRPHEAVERALRKHIDAALGALKAESVDVRFFPRTVPDRHGRALPFVRVRALVSEAAADVCRGKFSEALKPLAGAVVRLSVVEGAKGRMAVEIALAPSREIAEGYLDFDLPVFAPATEGVREAHFVLDAPFLDADLLVVEGRAHACNAALQVEMVDARTLRALVPAGYLGEHLHDHAFSARVGWLSRALGPSAVLESVGDAGVMSESMSVLSIAANVLVNTSHSAEAAFSLGQDMVRSPQPLLRFYPGATAADVQYAGAMVRRVMRSGSPDRSSQYAALWLEVDKVRKDRAARGLMEWEDDDSRPVTQSELKALEHFLDSIFRKAGLDIAFTRHFFDRVNDPRNRQQITAHELYLVFAEVFKKFAPAIKAHGADWEALIKDVTTAINIPFVLQYDRHTGLMSLVAKTVMRKDNFLTRDQKLVVATHDEPDESVNEASEHFDDAALRDAVAAKIATWPVNTRYNLGPSDSTPVSWRIRLKTPARSAFIRVTYTVGSHAGTDFTAEFVAGPIGPTSYGLRGDQVSRRGRGTTAVDAIMSLAPSR